MNQLINYEDVLLKDDVKRTFEKNYLQMLFNENRELPKTHIIEFIHKAQQTGANPSLNQIFLIKRNTKKDGWVGTTVFSYNFLLAIAAQTGQFNGYEIETKPIEKFDVSSMESKKMLASTCTVKRNGFSYPFTAYFDEFAQYFRDFKTGEQKLNTIWESKPYMMLEKCAIANALRRAFPEALSGIYCEEEMPSGEKKDASEKPIIEVKKEENKTDNLLEEKPIKDMNEVIKAQAFIEDAEEKKECIENLRKKLTLLTDGMDAKQKGSVMFDLTGMRSFTDANKKSLDELIDYCNKVDEILEENKLRKEVKPTSNAKKYFTID